jgi:hypothetical protein
VALNAGLLQPVGVKLFPTVATVTLDQLSAQRVTGCGAPSSGGKRDFFFGAPQFASKIK